MHAEHVQIHGGERGGDEEHGGEVWKRGDTEDNEDDKSATDDVNLRPGYDFGSGDQGGRSKLRISPF